MISIRSSCQRCAGYTVQLTATTAHLHFGIHLGLHFDTFLSYYVILSSSSPLTLTDLKSVQLQAFAEEAKKKKKKKMTDLPKTNRPPEHFQSAKNKRHVLRELRI